ncbi:hypothetical protein L2E82_50855 [Cichorium intybus]|nr:hypothetical protein L2E82_50855 [Cichorium intybus]
MFLQPPLRDSTKGVVATRRVMAPPRDSIKFLVPPEKITQGSEARNLITNLRSLESPIPRVDSSLIASNLESGLQGSLL